MDMQLTNRLALISGSTAGIGYAIAEALAREGARVIVNGRQQESVEAARKRIQSLTGSDVLGFAGDLSTADTADALVRAHPDIEVLVNNLGVFEPKPFEQIPDAEWVRFFEVNVLQRHSAGPSLPAGHEARQLGAHHLHLQRERCADTRRDDPLRHDQDGAAGRLSGVG